MAGPTAPTCGPPVGAKPEGLIEMDVRTFSRMSNAERRAWYIKMLSPYTVQVSRSATCNAVPAPLLATIVLNELADINWQDVWQQRLGMGGSLGIAQIQVDTALSNRLTHFPGDDARIKREAADAWRLCLMTSTSPMGGGFCPSVSTYENLMERGMVRHRLTIPEFAIEAAARETYKLLAKACANRTNPWPKKFNFSLASMSSITRANDVYNHIDGATQLAREKNLAEMIVAAYNSPDILIATQSASITPGSPGFIYANGTIHGSNSTYIAEDLHRLRLFRS